MNNAEHVIQDSAYDFKRLVCPVILDWIGGGELISIEEITTERIAKLFDREAGIDAVQIQTGEGIRGIASRVQWGWRDDYRSFTQRYALLSGGDTELTKRMRAIESNSGLFFPYWTSQAYVSKRRIGDLLYLCMIKTPDLYEFIKLYPHKLAERPAPGGNRFKVAWVADIKKAKYQVHIHENQYEIAKYTGQLDMFRGTE